MNRALAIIGGIGAGIAAAYFLDPKKGADRRALVRDKFNTLKDEASKSITDAVENLRKHTSGVAEDARAMIGDGSNDIGNPKQKGKVSQANVH